MRVQEIRIHPCEDCLGPLDRGLHYGDGLFETLRVAGGRIPFLPWHAARLQEGCARLALSYPEDFEVQAEALAARHREAVLKYVLTAGPGGRGYARDAAAACSGWFVFPLPEQETGVQGIRVRWCRHRLATQPALAGLKHLNRLDQVLARSEWSDPAIAEGILCDQEGHPVEGVQSNLFWSRDGRLHTPLLDRCGVAGVMRRAVLAWAAQDGIEVLEGRHVRDDLLAADEVFLTNSVRGILPVRRLEGRAWATGPLARRFMARAQRLWEGREGLPPC